MRRRVLLVLFAIVCVAAGCRGSTGLVDGPSSDPDLTPPISIDPAPEQLEELIAALRAMAAKAATPLPETAPYRSECPRTAKRIFTLGCYGGWCLDIYRTACGEVLLLLTNPEGHETWFHNGVPMAPPY